MSFARSRSLRRNKSWTSRIFWLLVAGGCMYIIDSIFLSNGNQNPSYMREKINGYLPDTLVIDEDNDAMYRDLPPQPKEFMEANGVRRKDHKPLVVLSTGGGLWNTGVWPGWGSEDPTSAKLNWAAAGVVVEKQCEYTCTFTHENSPENLEVADAVVMELVNHPKFLGKQAAKEKPIPWPQSRGRNTPLVYNFFYEPVELYYDYTTHPALQAHVHASIGPLQDTTLPITLLCPWGRGKDAYSHPPPVKRVDRPIAYFNEHGIAAANDRFVKDFINLMGDDQVHRYIHMKNTNLPPEADVHPYTLESRLALLGTYKFHLVTEPTVYRDWIEPEWSHTLISGSVPIYFGAPNINDYVPGRNSFINGNDYKTPQELAIAVRKFLEDDTAYNEFFAWKEQGPSEQFMTHVDHCAHYAECRICEHVHRNW